MTTAVATSRHHGAQRFDEIFAGICRVINEAVDHSPFGTLAVATQDGGYDSQFRCDAVRAWLLDQGISSEELDPLLHAFSKSDLLKSRRLKLVANNLVATRAIELGDYETGLHHASEGFSHWQHDVYNHRLVLQCKSKLGSERPESQAGACRISGPIVLQPSIRAL